MPSSTNTTRPVDPQLEERLQAAIEPWLAHMTWRRDFDAWRYRRVWQELHQADNVRDVRRALGSRVRGKAVLDLGAGMGGLSVALMINLGPEGLSLQAMDYNPDYAQIARLRARRYSLELPVAVAAGEALPYPNTHFDLVVCLDVLEHVRDPGTVLSEMYRVLRPGGRVITTVPNRHAFRDPHYHLPLINWLPRTAAERVIERAGRSKRGGPLHDRQALSELHTFTWAAFARLARSHGFRARDEVLHRLMGGEVRQLRGWRNRVLDLVRRTGLLRPIYRLYRYGWQGTYQILLAKPR